MISAKPLVGIPADYRVLAGTGVHMADNPYIEAIVGLIGAIPIILPALGEQVDWPALLAVLDGVLLTGSASNVAPERYGGPTIDPGIMQDARRDATNLPLIPAAVESGAPLIAICRGFQELNVAYGGSLHQKLHELPGRLDHRAKTGQPVDIMFGMAHPVAFVKGGLLCALTSGEGGMVNSLHWQGVDRLGVGLEVEAEAEDGTIEAVRVAGAPAFALGVQWHPEHRPTENPISRAVFGAFAEAVRRRRAQRTGGSA
jgi:putative glutamine amidotransferase